MQADAKVHNAQKLSLTHMKSQCQLEELSKQTRVYGSCKLTTTEKKSLIQKKEET